ncbi:olfactory receptor 4K14-like [Cavia porcellus]|uniref:Olfactory receptor n=1 Tax=Cavia porcellus TaxID=10141 RepID=A0A286XR03_CAVPO|nr:olfactory receptor 4K14-like [Cavia porcellus]
MDGGNQSTVSEFELLGLCHSWNIQILLFIVFLTFYLVILFGNAIILIIIIVDPHLHSPMYFFLVNLSFFDMWLSSVTTPKMITDFFREDKTISFGGCMCQILFVHFIAGSEMVLLVVMAYDRYVAICKPLHYSILMSLHRCIGLVVTAWTAGFLHGISQMVVIVQLSFCGPRKIDSFFCDIPLVIKLACMDSSDMGALMNADSGIVAVTCFILVLISYPYILLTVFQSSKTGAFKALSTCTAHITVVVIFFVPCIFIYVWPLNITWFDKFLAVFYSIFTPLLNPIIYTLRNKEMKSAMQRFRNYYKDSQENC